MTDKKPEKPKCSEGRHEFKEPMQQDDKCACGRARVAAADGGNTLITFEYRFDD